MEFEQYLTMKKHRRHTFWQRLYYRFFPLTEVAHIIHDLKLINLAYDEMLMELEAVGGR